VLEGVPAFTKVAESRSGAFWLNLNTAINRITQKLPIKSLWNFTER